MAKELPYFKFFISEWSDGDITLEDFETQGLFINLCAYYWSNECEVTLKKAKKKFKLCNPKSFDLLIESDIIKINGDFIAINFLNEQKLERKTESVNKSKGGKASAEARRLKKIEDEKNKDLTDVEQVLKSSSTESQLLREEEKRREERRKEESTTKAKLGKEEVSNSVRKRLDESESLRQTTCMQLKLTHEVYSEKIEEFILSNEDYDTWAKKSIDDNVKHFSNWIRVNKNSTSYSRSKSKDQEKDDDRYIYYQWENDSSIIARRVLIGKSESFFKNQLEGGYKAVILESIKNKQVTWR
jgi:hypothetical protein